ncbi:MAG: lysine-sensitive aspartokinase 3 [Deltaproteobacteria bacterium]|nr:MAG: lysine-sensitive aspartokinase 3 [Deltaproteobacteria bacterium]
MSQGIVVSKFGGTSMADATAMRRSAGVAKLKNSSIVVVSATSGTTNILVELSQMVTNSTWEGCKATIQKIIDNHLQIARDLEVPEACMHDLDELFKELKTLVRGMNLLKEASPKACDSLFSLGERMSSRLFTECLNQLREDTEVSCFDVRTVLRTDSNFGKAEPNFEMIKKLTDQHLLDVKYAGRVFVTQGFIGRDADGATTTLGRGGSDYSAAILAYALGAEKLEIWTDVAGIATTDPRLCSNARPIDVISFQEAAELASFGAKVLHPTTLLPAMWADIPVFVGSSYEPEKEGTWIIKDPKERPLIRAMAVKKDQTLLTLKNPNMLHAHGFLFDVFKVFNQHRVSVDSITTSEISVSMTVDDSTLLNRTLLEDLRQLGEVLVEEDLSLISLIGNNINHTPGLAAEIFNALGDINVRMICLGASKHNFCFLVNEQRAGDAIDRLHTRFIG